MNSTCFDEDRVSSICRPSVVVAVFTCLIGFPLILILSASYNACFCLVVTSINPVLLTLSADNLFTTSHLFRHLSSLLMHLSMLSPRVGGGDPGHMWSI